MKMIDFMTACDTLGSRRVDSRLLNMSECPLDPMLQHLMVKHVCLCR